MKFPTIKERKWFYWVYVFGAVTVQVGALRQIILTYTTRSAEDIALFWMVALMIGELGHFPLAFSSKYWPWKLAHIIAITLIITLFIGVLLYG